MPKTDTFTYNETVALMHEDTANAFKMTADHISKWKMSWEDVVKLMREIAEEKDAQSLVCRLRDEINPPIK